MKKWFSIVLALVLVLGLLAGCAGGKNPADDKILRVGISWAHYNDALFYAWGDGIEAVLKEGGKA